MHFADQSGLLALIQLLLSGGVSGHPHFWGIPQDFTVGLFWSELCQCMFFVNIYHVYVYIYVYANCRSYCILLQ